MPVRPIAQRIRVTSTSTGASTGVALFGLAKTLATVYQQQTGSTKDIVWKAQGTIGESGMWVDLMAQRAATTYVAAVNSTAGVLFDQVRIRIVTNDTTGNATLTGWVIANA